MLNQNHRDADTSDGSRMRGSMSHRSSVPVEVHQGGFIARLSLEYKLPLLMGALLLLVIVALSAAAYGEMRSSALRTASRRLSNVTTQLRDMLQLSGTQLRTLVAASARKPELAAFLQSRRPDARAAALKALAYQGPQPEQWLGSELRDSADRVLLSTAPSVGLDTISTKELVSARRDSATIGTFHRLRDTIVYPVVMAIANDDKHYVVQWRRLAGSRRAREQTTQLVGLQAAIFLGSPSSDLWTDLERPVRAPPVHPTALNTSRSYTRVDGAEHIASAMLVPGTPWMVAVDFPLSSVMAPVDQFMRRIALIAGVILLVGLGVAWTLTRGITDPLRQLTQASDAIGKGDYSLRPRVSRSDELGRLGQAFSVMSSEVQAAREGLERKVEERTRDLNATLDQLHDAQDVLVRKEKLAMLGQLSSGVGHELRNPLGVMTNAIYYLKTVLSSAPPNIHEYLDILQQQITLSEKIVSDLLDFARQKPPQRKPTSVAEITQAQINRLGATNGVRFERSVPKELPPVLVDPVQFGQIVLNLLTNAMQAVGSTGTIRVNAEVNNGFVWYDVQDSGPGIARENLEKVFEPLFTTKARGIGLGLAVSRTLARANNGELTVTSPPGEGARFRLILQAAESA
jgi:signal transduction histidine kinase